MKQCDVQRRSLAALFVAGRTTALSAALILIMLAAAAAEPKRVMLLHSFGRDFKPWSEYARTFRTELDRQSPWPIDFYEHSLETARSSDENPEKPFVDYLRAVFSKQRLDLIVSVGAPAAGFVQRHRDELFPNTPMLLTVVEQRRVKFANLTKNDAVVAVSINYLAAMENILRLLPDTKTVLVIAGNSPIEKFWLEEIRNEAKPLADRVALVSHSDLSFEDLLKRAAALPPQSAVFWELMLVDADGITHEEGKALARLRAVASAPIFSYTDAFFGPEIVGGPHVPVLEASQRAVDVAIRILSGELASDIKVPPVGFGTPKYNWKEMQRWGISENRLPPGSDIHFREQTVWELYRWQIVTVGLIVLFQSALISSLLFERRRRHSAEVETRQRISELAHMNRRATVGEMSASIAHELNQPLGAILNNSETMALILGTPSPDLKELRTIVEDIKRDDQRASEVILRLRRLLGKQEVERHAIDLNQMVREVAQIVSAQAHARGVTLYTTLSPETLRVSGDAVQLQQVLLNLLANALDSVATREGGRRAIITATQQDGDDSALISVEDSGPGIQPEKLQQIFEPFFSTKESGMGMGLSISRTIVEAHGGRIWAESHPGHGAVFKVRLNNIR
jgi:signal transduction histidine kinase